MEATAQAIQSQLQLSNTLSLGATHYATTGGVVADGAMDSALITQAMMDDYNAAIDAVINANYATAQTIFMDAHQAAMVNLNASVDQLVSATTVLSSVGTAGSWSAGAALRTTNQADFANTSSATFYITGVQLEAGDTATPFEHRSYGQELALCQRYYMRWDSKSAGGATSFPLIGSGYAVSSTEANYGVSTPSAMRVTPTLGFGGTIGSAHGVAGANLDLISIGYEASDSTFWFRAIFFSANFSVGAGGIIYVGNSSGDYFDADAEL